MKKSDLKIGDMLGFILDDGTKSKIKVTKIDKDYFEGVTAMGLEVKHSWFWLSRVITLKRGYSEMMQKASDVKEHIENVDRMIDKSEAVKKMVVNHVHEYTESEGNEELAQNFIEIYGIVEFERIRDELVSESTKH